MAEEDIVQLRASGKTRLNVPCLGWMYSQAPKIRAAPGLKAAIIIWWIEPKKPSRSKRQVFYSFLDEVGSPLRTNISKGFSRDNQDYKERGFNVHLTNTNRYIYPVPKMVASDGRKLAGRNLWKDYDSTTYVQPFIADNARLIEQKLMAPGSDPALNVLASARDTADEQKLYRNIVVDTCQTGDVDNLADDPVCATNEDLLRVVENLQETAAILRWDLPVFMQYIIDNTLANFTLAGVQNRIEDYMKEILQVQWILFQEKGYGYATDAAGKFILVENLPAAGAAAPRAVNISGLKEPLNPPPWV